MAAWSFAPWLIALVVAAGLGWLGWFTEHRSRQRNQDVDSDQGDG
ncbi:MAG TPA: hypothetical protein VHF06_37635 [Pseudonocardiaceae bacterium]|jgi:hypothetical protein|nr:hypothetical protein [Pseudonocardiaceae bacterium]